MFANSKLAAFLAVTGADRARDFFRDTLGLKLVHEDAFALVFDVNGVSLRLQVVGEFKPQPFTVLGWQVEEAAAMARRLHEKGIELERYPWLVQDESGLWQAPGGAKVGWFKDPDGNVLSMHQAPPVAKPD
jgi:catechol 2,3-dioxygenase-like lactoylglutathione lyase family enzyme